MNGYSCKLNILYSPWIFSIHWYLNWPYSTYISWDRVHWRVLGTVGFDLTRSDWQSSSFDGGRKLSITWCCIQLHFTVILAIAGVNHSLKIVLLLGRLNCLLRSVELVSLPSACTQGKFDTLTYREFSPSQWWKRRICRRRSVATVDNFRALGHSTRRWAPRN